MGQATIAEVAALCNDVFAILLGLDPLCRRTDKAELAEAIEEEQARFRIWSKYIGAFADSHYSLDFRLRESDRVKLLVISQLEILQATVKQLIRFLDPVYATEVLPAFKDEDEDGVEDELEEVDDENDGDEVLQLTLPSRGRAANHESDEGVSSEEEDASEEGFMLTVRSAIDRLHRLARAIRTPGLATSGSRASRYKVRDEFGNDQIEAFETFSAQVIQLRCPGAPGFLVRRLSKVNAARRRLFLYRKKHSNILAGRSHHSPQRRTDLSRRESQVTFTKSVDIEFDSMPVVSAMSTPKSHVESQPESSQARATSFHESQFVPENSTKSPSSRGGTSIASFIGTSRLPPAPKIPPQRTHFECPYCCQMISSDVLKKKGSWRKHLMKDLEPYVCVFEHCSEADTTYRDQNAWTAHLKTHATRWSCRLPHPKRSPSTVTFTTGDDYVAHLQQHSGPMKSLNDAQIQRLKRQNGMPDPNPLKSCPFCDDVVHVQSDSIMEPIRGNFESPAAVLNVKMQKHVAQHLMMIASYALPWLDEADGDVASDKALSLTTGRTSSELTEDREAARAANERELFEEFGALTFDEPDDISSQRDLDEWDFVKGDDYEGQEFDDVLSPFVRQYHVDMAFSGVTEREPVLPCIYLPMIRDTDFFGRDYALDFVRNLLCPEADDHALPVDTLKTCSIYGPAGFGKTHAAVEFVHQNLHKFDAVFWVHADETSKMIEDVNRITVQLGLVDKTSADSGDQALTRDLFRRWLDDPVLSFKKGSAAKAKWLLVLDHVIESNVLNQFWPTRRENGSILITSRRPMPWPSEKYPSITLQRFTPEEGAEFMCSLLNEPVSSQEVQCASLITAKVKGVPYALRHLTKWIVGEKLSFSEFLEQNHFRENQKLQSKMKGELARFVIAEEHSFLEAAFESLRHARKLLDVLSMLDPDNIPEHILVTESPYIFIKGYPITTASLQEALHELRKYSLIIPGRRSGTILIPRIVQDAVRKQMSPIYSRDVFNTCILLLSAQWPFHTFTWRHGISRWPQCEELFPHAIRLMRLSATIKTNEYHLYGAYLYARLWCDCGWYCHERGKTTDSELFSGEAERLCEELKRFYPLLVDMAGEHVPSERDIDDILAEVHHNRGVIANETNRPDQSLRYLVKFNEMMLAELGERRAGTDMRLALSFNELGCAWMLQDDYPHAEECFKKSIKAMKVLDNYEPWQVSLPGVNLGVVYWLTGRNDEALEVLLKGLRDRERKFGYNDQESFITGRFLYALGNVYESNEKYDTSLEYHQRSLNHYRNTLGSGHHRTADAFVRITKHFLRLNRLEDALELIDKAIQIYHDFDSAFEAECARAKLWKSRVLRQAGDVEGADRELKESVQWYCELTQQDATTKKEVRDTDFDDLIVFWSR